MVQATDRSAVVVLGGAILPHGQVPTWVAARADAAAHAWHDGNYDVVITTGRGTASQGCTAAAVLADALIRRGLPTDVLRRERDSSSAAESAWYVRRGLLSPLGIREITLVTNSFHVSRAARLFTHVLGDEYTVTALATDDVGIPADILPLLQICENAHDEYLTALLPRIPAGSIEVWHDYLFNPTSALAQLWRAHRDGHTTYRRARAQLRMHLADAPDAV